MAKRAFLFAVIGAVLSALVGACGNDTPGRTQSAGESTQFDDGAFGDLPLYPRSAPLGEVTRTEDTVSRSYRATMASPRMVLEFYEDSLVDWDIVEAPKQIGAGSTMRGVWRGRGFELTVSATEGPTVPEENAEGGNDDGAVSQYSLSLRDRS